MLLLLFIQLFENKLVKYEFYERERKKGGLVVHRREENSLEHLNFKYDDINPKYCEMMMKNSDAMTTTKN